MNSEIQDHLLQAYRSHQAGKLAEAESAYQAILQAEPENVDALNLLGVLYTNNFRPDAAVLCISRALKLQHRQPEAHANIALAYKDQGQLELAVKHFRESIRQDPWQAMVYNNLGNVLREMSQPREAIRVYESALKLDGEFAQCWCNLAAALNEDEQRKPALRAVERALSLEPTMAQAHNNKGDISLAEGKYDEALACYRRATELNPKYVTALINMARTLRDMDRPGEALEIFQHALQLEPNNPEAHHAMGVLQEQVGNQTGAAEAFQSALKVAPGMAIAHYFLAQLRGRKISDQEFSAMLALREHQRMSPHDRMFLSFGLARAYEQQKDYDRAYECIAQGNRIKAEQQPYDDVDTRKFVDSLADTAAALAARLGFAAGIDDERPVFVLGMPRSGTSLVEQVLASHSEVAAAGELPYAYDMAHRVREVTGRAFPENLKLLSPQQLRSLGEYYLSRHRRQNLDARRLIDKTPLNFQYIGLLGLALPGARFIHCYRDPVQNCFSIHKIPFDRKQAYAHSLTGIGQYYLRYWNLMQRWHQLFPGRILDVRYEDTVADLERQSRRMLEFLGLPFEAGVLEYHSNERLVKTPSASQVRQPIYGEALQSWKNYEKHLQPLLDSLGPMAAGHQSNW